MVVHNGTFLTGTLFLRSHVELHLTSTAVLQGVGDLAQYRADSKVVYKLLNQSLVFAEGCEHVAITGQGTIDGQGKAFRNGELRPPQSEAPQLYKESPLGWIPREWGIADLRTAALPSPDSFMDGDWIEAPYITSEGIRLIQTGNIGVGTFLDKGDSRRFISEASFRLLNCSWVKAGDILICRLADPIGLGVERLGRHVARVVLEDVGDQPGLGEEPLLDARLRPLAHRQRDDRGGEQQRDGGDAEGRHEQLAAEAEMHDGLSRSSRRPAGSRTA